MAKKKPKQCPYCGKFVNDLNQHRGECKGRKTGPSPSEEKLNEIKKSLNLKKDSGGSPPDDPDRFLEKSEFMTRFHDGMKDWEIQQAINGWYDRSIHGQMEFKEQEELSEKKYREKPIERRRTKESDQAAQSVIDRTKRVGEKITNDVRSICTGNGGKMFGIDHRYKGQDSLSGKIETEYIEKHNLNPNYTYEDAAKEIHDSLRFTSVIEPEKFTEHVDKTLSELEGKGQMLVKFQDTYKENSLYKGLNCNLKSPDGFIYELQFHTPESLERKEQFISDGKGGFRACEENEKSASFPSHKYYEESRAISMCDRKVYLVEKLTRLWRDVENPKGLDKISPKWTKKVESNIIKAGGK